MAQDKSRLVSESPVRRIGTSRRSITGRITVANERTDFESALERDFLLLLDFDRMVRQVRAQPFRIPYWDKEGKKHHYTPDFFVRYATGQQRIYEVKYREALREDWKALRPKFRSAVGYAQERGMRFSIQTEKEIRQGPVLDNIRFLRSYRDTPADPGIDAHLMSTLAILGDTREATPDGLLTAAYHTWENRMLAVRHLWRLLAASEIETDLSVRLTMQSRLWISPGMEDKWQDPHFYDSNRAR